MRYMVRRPYRYGDKVYLPGDAMPVEGDVARVLQNRGIIGAPVQAPRETAAVKPPEKAVKPKAEIKPLGGGWYEVRGQKVQGKDNAEEAAGRPFE